jgi:hypothetical protein
MTIKRKPLKADSLSTSGTTTAERLLMVWPLTIEAWAMQGEDIAQFRLARHVVHVHQKATVVTERGGKS